MDLGSFLKITTNWSHLKTIPSAKEAINLAKKFAVPLHPKYTDYWGNISVSDLSTLREALIAGYDDETKKINLKNRITIKEILERAFVPHELNEDCLILDEQTTEIYETIFNLNHKEFVDMKNEDNVFNYFSTISPIEIRNKAPYYMGTRMGRPEKSERKSMKGIQSLFPLSDKVGNTRLVQKAIKMGRIKINICRKKCPNCSSITPFNQCPKCGSHTEFQKICLKCNKYYPKSEEKCQQCGGFLNSSKEASFNIENYSKTVLGSLNMSLPDKFKGILGLSNKFKVPEPLMKGILRAKNGLLVYKYKTAEIRYDATDIPLTHFKPKEIATPVSSLIELGYEFDYKANELNNDNQILELKVQDVILSDDCAEYFIKIANFIDDELEVFYNLDKFYNITKREDLI
ncbi:MAG: hypothetical protein ACTSQL_02285, partial [Promethearchaeota archaeon]